MHLEIITPEKMLYKGEIDLVQLPGTSGSFEILHNHAPMISTLSEGKVKIKDSEGTLHYFDISGGVAEVVSNTIRVLVE